MALGGFLSRSAFMRKLVIAEASFEAPGQRQVTNLAGGEVLSAEIAPALWQGEISLSPMRGALAREVVSVLHHLEISGNAFRAFHPEKLWPLTDAGGATAAAATITISAHDASASTITVAGLPNGYVVSPGDMISWEYGSSPTRYALHEFREGATVSAGSTGALQVYPHIRGTVPTNAPAEMVRPWCKAIVLPGSASFECGMRSRNRSKAFRSSFGRV